MHRQEHGARFLKRFPCIFKNKYFVSSLSPMRLKETLEQKLRWHHNTKEKETHIYTNEVKLCNSKLTRLVLIQKSAFSSVRS